MDLKFNLKLILFISIIILYYYYEYYNYKENITNINKLIDEITLKNLYEEDNDLFNDYNFSLVSDMYRISGMIFGGNDDIYEKIRISRKNPLFLEYVTANMIVDRGKNPDNFTFKTGVVKEFSNDDYDLTKYGIIIKNNTFLETPFFEKIRLSFSEIDIFKYRLFDEIYKGINASSGTISRISLNDKEMDEVFNMHIIFLGLADHERRKVHYNVLSINEKIIVKSIEYNNLRFRKLDLLKIILSDGNIDENITIDEISKKLKEKGPTILHYYFMPFIKFICDIFRINSSELRDIDSNTDHDSFNYKLKKIDDDIYKFGYNMDRKKFISLFDYMKKSITNSSTTSIVNKIDERKIMEIKESIKDYCM